MAFCRLFFKFKYWDGRNTKSISNVTELPLFITLTYLRLLMFFIENSYKKFIYLHKKYFNYFVWYQKHVWCSLVSSLINKACYRFLCLKTPVMLPSLNNLHCYNLTSRQVILKLISNCRILSCINWRSHQKNRTNKAWISLINGFHSLNFFLNILSSIRMSLHKCIPICELSCIVWKDSRMFPDVFSTVWYLT